MAKNRRNQSAAIRFGPAIKALLLCAFIGGSGLGYVWQKKQIFKLGRQITQLEQHREKLRLGNQLRQRQLDEERLPWMLERRMNEKNLGLRVASPRQMLRLAEPALPRPAGPGETRMAMQ